MRQSILVEPQKSRVEERPLPDVGPEDVLVRVRVCGVCASELHGWRGDGGAYPREYGHEVSGDVVEVGREVRDLQPSTAVTGLFQQGYAEYVLAPRSHVAAIPEGITYEAALGEPLSCIVSGARRTGVELGDRVAIIGLGFMGLLMLQAVRLQGAGWVAGIDIREEALDRARHFGADEVFTPDQVPAGLKVTGWSQMGMGDGVDVAIEASGTDAGLALAAQMAREHGVLSLLSLHHGGPRQADFGLWEWKALQVVIAHERRARRLMDNLRRALALVGAGKLDVAALVTHRFGLEGVDQAFEALAAKPQGFVKGVILVE